MFVVVKVAVVDVKVVIDAFVDVNVFMLLVELVKDVLVNDPIVALVTFKDVDVKVGIDALVKTAEVLKRLVYEPLRAEADEDDKVVIVPFKAEIAPKRVKVVP